MKNILRANFKPCCWIGLLLKNGIVVEISKYRKRDTHFCSFIINMLFLATFVSKLTDLAQSGKAAFLIGEARNATALALMAHEKLEILIGESKHRRSLSGWLPDCADSHRPFKRG